MPNHSLLLLFFTVLVLALSACGTKTDQPQPITSDTLSLHWEPQPCACNAHLRGLSMIGDSVIWASGTQGTVLNSTDGGLTWWAIPVPGADSLDFRDIEAFDDLHAIVMSSGNGVHIYRTTDGGTRWTLTYSDPRPEVFFDGMDFSDPATGFAYGDPLDGKLLFLTTSDSGRTWTPADPAILPAALEHEAGFAASGTGIVTRGDHTWIATGGGRKARVMHQGKDHKWSAAETPLRSGEATGIFSMCFWDDLRGTVVGGSYIDSTRADSNAAYTRDGGQTWQLAGTTPSGYRSCVAANGDGSLLIATGRTGSDYSTDGGRSWARFSNNGYYSCAIGKKTAWGVGRNGKMGRMKFE